MQSSRTFMFTASEFPELASASAPPRRELVSKSIKRKLKEQALKLPVAVGKTGIAKKRGGGQSPSKRITTRSDPSSPTSSAMVVEDHGCVKKTARRPTKPLLKKASAANGPINTTSRKAELVAALDSETLKDLTELNTATNMEFSVPSSGASTPARIGRRLTFAKKTKSKVFSIIEGEGIYGRRMPITGSPIGNETGRLKRPAEHRTGKSLIHLTAAQKEDLLGPSKGLEHGTLASNVDRGCMRSCPDGFCINGCICKINGIYCDNDCCHCTNNECSNHDPKLELFDESALINQYYRGLEDLSEMTTPNNSTIPSVDVTETSVQAATVISDIHVTKRRGRVTKSLRSSPYAMPTNHPNVVIRDRRKRASSSDASCSSAPPAPAQPLPILPAAGLPIHGIKLSPDLFGTDFWLNYLPTLVSNDELECLNPNATGQAKWLTDGAVYLGLLKEASLANMRGGKYAVLHPGIYADWPARINGESDDDLARREPDRESIHNNIYFRQDPEYLLMPLHHTDHWALGIYRVKESTCVIYDSLSPSKTAKDERLQKLKRVISKLVDDHIVESIKFRYAYTTHSERQSDGVECGIFTIVNGRRLMEGRKDLRNKRKSNEIIDFSDERKRLRSSLDDVQVDLGAIERANTAAAQNAGQQPVQQPVDIRPPAPQPAPPLRRSQRNTIEANRKIKQCCDIIGSRTPKAFGARRRRR